MTTFSKLLVIAAGSVVLLSACGDKKENAAPAAATVDMKNGALAYVDADTLQEKYQFCIDKRAELEALQKSQQAAVQQKEQALQQLQASVQKRMQNGQISTPEQYQAEEKKFMQQQEAYQRYLLQAQQELEAKKNEIDQALQDSVNHFLAEYNKNKKYAMIVYKAAALYADPKLDITNEIVVGLNKRYKK